MKEVTDWLYEHKHESWKLCGRRPHIPVKFIGLAAHEVYLRRDKVRPIRIAWEIWERAEALMLQDIDPMPLFSSMLEAKLYMYERPWYIKLFDGGIYPEGIRGEYIS